LERLGCKKKEGGKGNRPSKFKWGRGEKSEKNSGRKASCVVKMDQKRRTKVRKNLTIGDAQTVFCEAEGKIIKGKKRKEKKE